MAESKGPRGKGLEKANVIGVVVGVLRGSGRSRGFDIWILCNFVLIAEGDKFDPLACGMENRFTVAQQSRALFVMDYQFFEGKVLIFHCLDDGFETAEGFFEGR